MTTRLASLFLCSLLALPLAGCGVSTYQPGRSTSIDLDGSKEINDEDVRKAFEANPQLTRPFRVAFYSLDVSKSDDIERSLRQVQGVSDVYRIPPLMVNGQRRFDDGRYMPPQELNQKKLRLLAARARADVVIIYDYGHKVEGSANGWVALTPLILPIFFVPFIDRKVESFLDTYVIDTRNGFLYAHVTADEKAAVGSINIYHDDDPTIKANWEKVLAGTQAKLAAIASAAPAAAAPAAAPAAPRPAAAPPVAAPAVTAAPTSPPVAPAAPTR